MNTLFILFRLYPRQWQLKNHIRQKGRDGMYVNCLIGKLAAFLSLSRSTNARRTMYDLFSSEIEG
jgi:hypothetical protein